jgi:hypothetical protein
MELVVNYNHDDTCTAGGDEFSKDSTWVPALLDANAND